MKLITIKELANLVGVNADTIRKWEDAEYISSIRTLGGHRRYLESDAKLLIHQMSFSPAFFYSNTPECKAWLRKDCFLWWKRFVSLHCYNTMLDNDPKEIQTREGSQMVLDALEMLSDDDWKSIDKIDEALQPVYKWYKKYHDYYSESSQYRAVDDLKNGKYKSIKEGVDVTQEVIKAAEKHYQKVLVNLKMKEPSHEELDAIGFRLDGVAHVLWGTLGRGGLGDGSPDDLEKSVLEGNGLFPSERLHPGYKEFA